MLSIVESVIVLLKRKRALVVWAAAIATAFTACSGGQIDTVRVESPSGRVRITATVGDGGVSYPSNGRESP